MFLIDAIVFLLLFLLAGAFTAGLAPRTNTIWLAGIVAVGAVVLYDVLVLAMPSWGAASEVWLGAMAALALVPVMVVVQCDWRRPAAAQRPWLALCVLPMLVAVMMPWTVRVAYAQRLAWACDGPIVSKYRSNNHNAAALVVQTGGQQVTLDAVDELLWQQAIEGERLVKPSGSAFGRLQERPVRIVPRTLPWWNEQ